MKACHQCEHFNFWTGSHGYSEMTPGSDAALECGKQHWRVRMFDDDVSTVRGYFAQAETCPDWAKYTPEGER